MDWGGGKGGGASVTLTLFLTPTQFASLTDFFFFFYPTVEPGPRLDNLNQIHQLQYHFSQIYKQEHSMRF